MKTLGTAGSPPPLAEGATRSGFDRVLKKYAAEWLIKNGPLRIRGQDGFDSFAQLGAKGPLESVEYLRCCAANIYLNSRPVHCPLPLSLRSDVLLRIGCLDAFDLGQDWERVLSRAKVGPKAYQLTGRWLSAHATADGEGSPIGWSLRSEVEHSSSIRGPPRGELLDVVDTSNNGSRYGDPNPASRDASRRQGLRYPVAKSSPVWHSVSNLVDAVSKRLRAVTGAARTYARSEIVTAALDCFHQALCRCLPKRELRTGLSPEVKTTFDSRIRGSNGMVWQSRGPGGKPGLIWTTHIPASVAASAARGLGVEDVLNQLQTRDASLRIRTKLRELFPRKADPQAGAKPNIFLDCLLADVEQHASATFGFLCSVLAAVPPQKVTEDQVCNAILYSYCLFSGTVAVQTVAALLCSLANGGARLKCLSDTLKATGSNMIFEWAQLCELNCLLGRGVDDLDLEEDALRRCRGEKYMEVEVDPVKLRRAVTAVLADELGGRLLNADSLEKYWERRFEWCVAGAHSATTNQYDEFAVVPAEGPRGTRMSRRAAMEYVATNPLDSWDGVVRVSVIPKLEQGKTRAIYSCNTISYAAFGRILRPAEQAWAGRRVLLDPGAGGNYGMYKRIRQAWPQSLPVAVMLDYSDFNSQHTISSQQIVIKCLAECFLNLDKGYVDTLVKSFECMELFLRGRHLGHVVRGLMSGHRGTSFINSVLNAAYIRMTLGEEVYREIQSFHVGDDVLMFCKDVGQAYTILDSMKEAGFHLQASKQSVGMAGFEFLRMAGTKKAAHGYLARSVASLVSGNWTTDLKPDPLATAHSFAMQARSLINRSGNDRAFEFLIRSLQVFTSLPSDICSEILSGSVAIGKGPVYRSDGRFEYREVLEMGPDDTPSESRKNYSGLPNYATADYFYRGCTEVERRAMELVGFKPWAAALRSSYGDLAESDPVGEAAEDMRGKLPPRTIALGAKRLFAKSGCVDLDKELDRPSKRGLLVQYPVIALLQQALTVEHLRELLNSLGHSVEPGMEREAAFGGESAGAVIQGFLPYADSAALCRRGLAQSIRVLYPLRM